MSTEEAATRVSEVVYLWLVRRDEDLGLASLTDGWFPIQILVPEPGFEPGTN